MSKITVVPDDRLIIVDDDALQFDFSHPDNLHALQWQGDKGHLEIKGDANKPLVKSDYNTVVKPYVDAFMAEKKRLDEEQKKAEKEYQEWYNSDEQTAIRVRGERQTKIAATDYLLFTDYPIEADKLVEVKAYRKALRDITKQEGFPHDVVWPEIPEIR